MKELESDYCKDLVKDTNSTLRWLDLIDKNTTCETKKTFKPYTFDFESLYDSLTPELIIESLHYAMDTHRLNWSPEFKNWIIDNVKLGFQSAVGVFNDQWYRAVKGLPTGGSLSVQLANIAVYYVLSKCLYNNNHLMSKIYATKRFIDDVAGVFTGTERQFENWKTDLLRELNKFGLNVKSSDWNIGLELGQLVNFLDIQFGFSFEGNLVTDIYIKETDSKSFLNFSSCHPPHIFSSVLYSQALRYRRIINSTENLKAQLQTLKFRFTNSGYPKTMIDNIFKKVESLDRNLVMRQNSKEVNNKAICVISTYGNDNKLCNLIKSIVPSLVQHKIIDDVKFVKKTAPSLRNILSNSKHISLKNKYGTSKPCQNPRCKNCTIMSNKSYIENGKIRFRTASGTCKSRNIIYAAACQLCHKIYVGKSTQIFAYRNNGHRAKFIKYMKQVNKGNIPNTDELDDEYALSIHLHQSHGIKTYKGFDDNLKFTILENCSPLSLGTKEHLWIQRLRSLHPNGMNLNSPFGLPLLF